MKKKIIMCGLMLITGFVIAQNEETPLSQVATFLKGLAQQIEGIVTKQETQTRPGDATASSKEVTDEGIGNGLDTAEIQQAVISNIPD